MTQSKINVFFEEVLDAIKIGFVMLNADYSINKMNDSFTDMFEYQNHELQNKSINLLFDSEEFKSLQGYMKNADHPTMISSAAPIQLNGFRQDKSIIPLEINIIKSDDNQSQPYILIIRDLSIFKQTVEDLKNLAYYDQLTKIPNRTLFRDRAETAIRMAQRENDKLAIICIDIDDFKVINDTMGHEAGDILLKKLSKRFHGCVRGSDTVARVGGDEFTILMLKIHSISDVSLLADRILESNLIAVNINNHNIIPKTSLGISIFPKDGEDLDILLKNADTAMYCAKEKGRNQFVLYTH